MLRTHVSHESEHCITVRSNLSTVAQELAALFETLQKSDKAATRPSQRLANAVLLSTHTLLNSEKQSDRQASPLPPPLPSRPAPEVTIAAADGTGDVDMIKFDDQGVEAIDTASLSSTRTLVEQEEDGSDPSYERVEKFSGLDKHTALSTKEAADIVDDAVMVEGEATSTKPIEKVVVEKPPATLDITAKDVDMVDVEVLETVDQKVLSALERQKRSSGTDQQDVEEVMGSIINRLQAAIRPSAIDEKTGIQLERLMETFFVTTVNYTKKFHERNYQHEISFDRSITAFPAEDGPCTLYDALGKNFDQQILEDSKLSRYTTIRTLPPILHILIQRTQSNGSKNGNPVIIPETLYLDRFMDTDHDSPEFQRRVEDWIVSKRIADIKADLANVEANPAYLRSLERYTPSQPIPVTESLLVEEERAEEMETFDFDGPVEDDFLLVSPSKPASDVASAPVPVPLTGIYETYCQVKQMMEEELERCEEAIMSHHDEMRQVGYRLHAVICHRGQLMSGHYWVWIHDFEENVWRWYNDADVKENKDTQEVLTALSTSGEPYFLCYVKDEDKDKFVNVPKRERPQQPEPGPALAPEPMPHSEPEIKVTESTVTEVDAPTATYAGESEKLVDDSVVHAPAPEADM